ncbi:MAG TPA: metallophosphoesterase family protein [Candidatus Hydrogenedentes bacterium]|nr:metallophosphoesterase family protein [Candidatus Hydrogenedentota bacterium]
MILGVFSDTHGNRKFLERARKLAVDHFGASALIHLGDNYSDAEELMLEFSPVWAVPGLWCAAYHNPSIPRTRLEGAGNLLIHFAHAEQNLEPESVERAQIILTGHTHHYRLDWLDGKIWMNPGHLKKDRDKTHPPTFGLIAIATDTVACNILNLEGETILAQVINQRFLRPVPPID